MSARGTVWFGLYLALALLPLVFALAAAPAAIPGSFAVQTGVACGFIALALIVLEVALVSRLRAASRPFGTDALMFFHRLMGIGALGFAAVHPLLVDPRPTLQALDPSRGPSSIRAGTIALWLLVALIGASLARKRLRLRYEWWQPTHGMGALVVVVLAVAHTLGTGRHAAATPIAVVIVLYGALFVGLLVAYRAVRPLWMWAHPWVIAQNRAIGGDTRLVALTPARGRPLAFEAGQFVWLVTGRTPFGRQQHPLSIVSSAEPAPNAPLELAVKALGDWSAMVVPALRPGMRVWVDGPYGAFTPERAPGQGFVLIAGGIGISPMRSMLLTMRDREDPRSVVLLYAARNPSRVVFADELAALERVMRLRVVYVYEEPPGDWRGERGFVTDAMLRRHLPPHHTHHQYFVCGPPAMMDALEGMLRRLGVAGERVHTERFDMV